MSGKFAHRYVHIIGLPAAVFLRHLGTAAKAANEYPRVEAFSREITLGCHVPFVLGWFRYQS